MRTIAPFGQLFTAEIHGLISREHGLIYRETNKCLTPMVVGVVMLVLVQVGRGGEAGGVDDIYKRRLQRWWWTSRYGCVGISSLRLHLQA
jgi:hypothetical protein